jgi:hypothetical protein
VRDNADVIVSKVQVIFHKRFDGFALIPERCVKLKRRLSMCDRVGDVRVLVDS